MLPVIKVRILMMSAEESHVGVIGVGWQQYWGGWLFDRCCCSPRKRAREALLERQHSVLKDPIPRDYFDKEET
jgi:hypothetical protein